jgi:endonuclease/exonuclease/phosphatase family metal-dependent hydrolase
MGDLNAEVGNENEGLEHVMGMHGTNRINENGEMFIDFCASQELTIGGTSYIKKFIKIRGFLPNLELKIKKTHMAISRPLRRSLLDVHTKRGADIGSDHHLVVASFQMKITNKKKHDVMRKRLDVKKKNWKLHNLTIKNGIKNRFEALNHSRY